MTKTDYITYAEDKNLYVCCDTASTKNSKCIAYSANGVNWTTVDVSSLGSGTWANFLYYTGNVFILSIGGIQDTNCGVYYSYDAKNWSQALIGGQVIMSIANNIIFASCDSAYSGISSSYKTLHYSVDGITFKKCNIPYSMTSGVTVEYVGGNYYFSEYPNKGLYYSTDIENWSKVSGGTFTTYGYKVINENNIYIASTTVANNNSNNVLYSYDGISNWTPTTTSFILPLKYVNNRFFNVSGSKLQTSTDGINWVNCESDSTAFTFLNDSPSYHYYHISYKKGTYILTMYTKGIFYSKNGVKWYATNIGEGTSAGTPLHINGIWVIPCQYYSPSIFD